MEASSQNDTLDDHLASRSLILESKISLDLQRSLTDSTVKTVNDAASSSPISPTPEVSPGVERDGTSLPMLSSMCPMIVVGNLSTPEHDMEQDIDEFMSDEEILRRRESLNRRPSYRRIVNDLYGTEINLQPAVICKLERVDDSGDCTSVPNETNSSDTDQDDDDDDDDDNDDNDNHQTASVASVSRSTNNVVCSATSSSNVMVIDQNGSAATAALGLQSLRPQPSIYGGSVTLPCGLVSSQQQPSTPTQRQAPSMHGHQFGVEAPQPHTPVHQRFIDGGGSLLALPGSLHLSCASANGSDPSYIQSQIGGLMSPGIATNLIQHHYSPPTNSSHQQAQQMHDCMPQSQHIVASNSDLLGLRPVTSNNLNGNNGSSSLLLNSATAQQQLHQHNHHHPQNLMLHQQPQQQPQRGPLGGVVGLAGHNNQVVVGDDVSRKREVRLLKNREAAKECRRKKKEYVKCLENRVAALEQQNKQLIDELKSLKDLYCRKPD